MRSLRLVALGASLVVSASLSACGGEADPEDAGVDAGELPDAGGTDAGAVCSTDADCDNGLYCDGTETCVDGACAAGEAVDCDDGIACTTDACSETTRDCSNTPPDADDDGVFDAACIGSDGLPLGRDCDDADPDRFPGNPEVCDASHDEDCNLETFGTTDEDADLRISDQCCNIDGDTRNCGDDCDDGARLVFTGAPELCDDTDNDCDMTVDEELSTITWGADCDGDAFGVLTDPAVMDCAEPTSPPTCPMGMGMWVTDVSDCDDTLASRNPGLVEVCDGIDNNCDPMRLADEGLTFVDYYPDCDGDGRGSDSVMALNVCAVPAAPTCPGGMMGTWVTSNDDCDDTNANVFTGRAETCDGIDNNCDAGRLVDEGLTFLDYYPDCDGDGDGDDMATAINACSVPTPLPTCGAMTGVWVTNDDDCDDADALITTTATEVCDYIDNDCDGTIDIGPMGTLRVDGRRDNDGDGIGVADAVECAGAPNFQASRSGPIDCDDTNMDVYPGQTAYFAAPSSYTCDDPTYNLPCPGDPTQCGRNRVWCIMPGVCVNVNTCVDTPPDTRAATGVWNYDCDGTPDRPIFDSCSCLMVPGRPVCIGGYQDATADCGDTVEHRTCGPAMCVSFINRCDVASTEMRTLPCR